MSISDQSFSSSAYVYKDNVELDQFLSTNLSPHFGADIVPAKMPSPIPSLIKYPLQSGTTVLTKMPAYHTDIVQCVVTPVYTLRVIDEVSGTEVLLQDFVKVSALSTSEIQIAVTETSMMTANKYKI